LYRTKSETARFAFDYLLLNVAQTADAIKVSRAPLPAL